MSDTVRVISSREFATAFALRPANYSWLLGAGASAASGIPTGYMMIRDFKKRIFCRDLGYPLGEVDSSDSLWLERIEGHAKQKTDLPPTGDPNEYSATFEAVYTSPSLRRQYIDDAIRLGTPSFGHRVLAALISARIAPAVFTTNFDPLIEEAVAAADELLPAENKSRPTVAALDSAERALRCLKENAWPLIAKLHGDYQSSQLKNTNSELQEQDAIMRQALTKTCQRYALVVVGYSGRDASVINALAEVTKTEGGFPGGIYWVTSSPGKVLPAVRQLMADAHSVGVEASFVQSATFDELAGDLANQVLLPETLSKYALHYKPRRRLEPAPTSQYEVARFPVLRCSALLVEAMPRVARRIVLSKQITTAVARQVLKENRVAAVVAANGTELAAFGNDERLLEIFASYQPKIDGVVELEPSRDSWALGMLYDALTKAFCRKRPLIPILRSFGHSVIVGRGRPNASQEQQESRLQTLARLQNAYQAPLIGLVPKLNFPFAEGLTLKLECLDDRWWCGFEPFTSVEMPRPQVSLNIGESDKNSQRGKAVDPTADWRREQWARRYNPRWASIIDAWADLLTGADGQLSAFGLGSGVGIDAEFSVSLTTAWSRPGHQHSYFERKK